jgi:hypothetical protein
MKLIAFGSRAARSVADIDVELAAALQSSGFEGVGLRATVRPLVAPSPSLDEETAHFFEVGGPVLSSPAPDCVLTVQATGARGCEDALRDKVGELLATSAVYSVDESVVVAGEADGVCRVGLVERNASMTRARFWEYWNSRHAPLVLQHGPLFSRYVTNLVLDEGCTVDGIVEQWFPDEQTMREHDRRNAKEKPAIASDIPRFIRRTQQFLVPNQ